MKRLFDFTVSLLFLFLLSPFYILISLIIIIDSKGKPIYTQRRVGKNNTDFKLYKFRTMHVDADKMGLLTVGKKDKRITRIGYYLRKCKIDELPQLFNVLIGTMSFVGPRPEVRKYVEMYTNEQLKVLTVKPGITDLASIAYIDENTLLAQSKNPEDYYINQIMPHKLSINLNYIKNRSFLTDILIILKTFIKIIR